MDSVIFIYIIISIYNYMYIYIIMQVYFIRSHLFALLHKKCYSLIKLLMPSAFAALVFLPSI